MSHGFAFNPQIKHFRSGVKRRIIIEGGLSIFEVDSISVYLVIHVTHELKIVLFLLKT